jgi:hypothetical protein
VKEKERQRYNSTSKVASEDMGVMVTDAPGSSLIAGKVLDVSTKRLRDGREEGDETDLSRYASFDNQMRKVGKIEMDLLRVKPGVSLKQILDSSHKTETSGLESSRLNTIHASRTKVDKGQ